MLRHACDAENSYENTISKHISFSLKNRRQRGKADPNVLRLLIRVSNINDIVSRTLLLCLVAIVEHKILSSQEERIVGTRYRNLSERLNDVDLGSRLCGCAFLGVCHRFEFDM